MRRRRRNSTANVFGLSSDEITRLAVYNGERSRGIVHSDEYAERMSELQRQFDEARLAEARANGWIIV